MGFWILSINSQNPAGTPRPYLDAPSIDLAKYAISAVLAPQCSRIQDLAYGQEGPGASPRPSEGSWEQLSGRAGAAGMPIVQKCNAIEIL